jgi:hypothetical protein
VSTNLLDNGTYLTSRSREHSRINRENKPPTKVKTNNGIGIRE